MKKILAAILSLLISSSAFADTCSKAFVGPFTPAEGVSLCSKITAGTLNTVSTTGSLIANTSGGTLQIQEATAASKCMGSVTFNGTTAVAVSTTCAATGARIFLSPTSDPTGATAAYCWATNIVNGVSFDVDCDQANDGTANWFIIKEAS